MKRFPQHKERTNNTARQRRMERNDYGSGHAKGVSEVAGQRSGSPAGGGIWGVEEDGGEVGVEELKMD